ncbi:S-layer homology domain-containing protein [Aeromicrobium alkaliterrae]|uniref:S-layer homology domain-containing protein n=1 Tax=Aeromicrobium alkaliterrae TaxID=302168 RepID=A0ABN2JPK6_9ACTN
MSTSIRRHRRLVGALIAGLALTLAPAATLSASAAPGDTPAPPTNLRIVKTPTPPPGEVTVAWNASATPDVSEYQITIYGPSYYDFLYVDAEDPLSYTITDLIPGAPVYVEIRALKDETFSQEAFIQASSLGEGEVLPFTDTVGNTFSYEINWLSSLGVTTGYADGTFRPGQAVLREQMAAFLFRLAGDDWYEAPQFSRFTDVPTTATFYREISWLYDTGISTGYSNGDGTRSFAPSQPVLREQMAAFLYRAYDSGYTHGSEPASFRDVPSSSTFFNQIEWLALEGITTGYAEPSGKPSFRGGQPVLREQMAAFLYRANGLFFSNEGPSGELAPSAIPDGAPLDVY